MQPMTMGVNAYSYIWTHGADAVLHHLADMGYTEIELMIAPPHLWPADHDAAARAATRRILEDRGLKIVSVNPPSLDQNLVSPVAEMRAYTVEMFRNIIELAGDLGVQYVVTVTGRIHPLFAPPKDQVWGWLRAGLEALIPHAEKAGVKIALENIPMASLPLADDLMEFLDTMDSDRLCICYDAANAEFVAEDPAQGLLRVAPRLELVHVSDTKRDVWKHDPVGMGQVDFAAVAGALREIGYKGVTMMEIISHTPDADITASHDKLAKMGWAGRP